MSATQKQILLITELENALQESLKLQCHYAELLNMYDGGRRITTFTVDSWMLRLKENRIHNR